MPNLFSVIKQNEEQKKIKDEKDKVAINTRLARDRALKQTQEEKEREKIEKVLLSTKDAFFDATSKLENSIKGIKDNPPTEHVNSLLRLIKQSKLIVNSSTDFKTKARVQELTSIVIWADNALNNKIIIAEQPWELLSNEMKKESFFDKRSNRVVGGICLAIIAAVAAFVLAPYLCHFGIQAMTVASTGPHNNLLFALGLYSFMASIPIFGSAVWHGVSAVHNVIYGIPESVGCEVRELANFFETPKSPASESSNQQGLEQAVILNI